MPQPKDFLYIKLKAQLQQTSLSDFPILTSENHENAKARDLFILSRHPLPPPKKNIVTFMFKQITPKYNY